MSLELDIANLTLRAHYGYIDLPFPQFAIEHINRFKEKTIDSKGIGKSAVMKDILGRPFFMDFKVSFNNQTYYLPNEPLLSISARNTIIKTAVLGQDRKGTVKEFINNDDYLIQIQGICFNPNLPDEYPVDQVDKIRQLHDYRGSIDIDNDLLRFFGIYSMAVESVDYADMVGTPGAQAYIIQAISDSDFYADLQDKERQKVLF